MSWNARALEERVSNSITDLANSGFRSLGVAVSFTNPDAGALRPLSIVDCRLTLF